MLNIYSGKNTWKKLSCNVTIHKLSRSWKSAVIVIDYLSSRSAELILYTEGGELPYSPSDAGKVFVFAYS